MLVDRKKEPKNKKQVPNTEIWFFIPGLFGSCDLIFGVL
jgi:hypothetical protein